MTRQRRKHRRTAALQVLALAGGIIALAGAALLLGYQLGGRAEAAEPVPVQLTTPLELPGLPRGAELYCPVREKEPRYALTEYERDLVERVVAAESGNQTLEGQMAVAQCILNTAEAMEIRPDTVVLAPNQYADPAAREQVTDSVREAELDQYHAVERFIARLGDPVCRTVLRLRYLEGLSWTQLQKRLYQDGLYYSERQIFRLHGAALQEARELWPKEPAAAEGVVE